MNTHAPILAEEAAAQTALGADAPFDPDGARTERHLRVLERLTDLGMALAEGLAARVKADDFDAGEISDIGTAFAKISRGVRMTVMLEEKLAKAWRLRQAGIAEKHEAGLQERLEAEWAVEREADNGRVAKRQQALDDAVKDVIRAERPEGYERERLFDRLEGLWKDDIDNDLSAPPSFYIQIGGDEALISEQIAAFCKALGLKPDWDLWKDSFWAMEEAEDGAIGSPYAARGTGPP